MQQKVEALADFSLIDPISPRVAVAQVKRFLRRPEDRIHLHDFFLAETERVVTGLQKVFSSVSNIVLNQTSGLEHLRKCEAEMSTLLPAFICAARWGDSDVFDLLAGVVKRIGDNYTPENGYEASLRLRRYPALLLLYGAGLAASAGRNYGLLSSLFRLRIKPDLYSPETSITELHNPFKMWSLVMQRQLIEGRQTKHTPLNDHVFDVLNKVIREYISSPHVYDQTFDWFEYLLGLIYCDQTFAMPLPFGNNQEGIPIRYGPPGRFFCKSQRSDEAIDRRMHLGPPGEPLPAEVEAAFASGLCRTPNATFDAKRYEELKAGFDSFLGMLRSQLGLYF